MSLDSRLRSDLREVAASVDPSTETALRDVLARRRRAGQARRVVPRAAAVAASVLLLAGLVAWWLAGRGTDPQVVTDPLPPAGTYEATLSGALAGDWRLRVGPDTLSVVAPDAKELGKRVASGSYDVHGGVLTTHLLADGPCSGTGSYTWLARGGRLHLAVEQDDCDPRVRLLTSAAWAPVSGKPLANGTYETPALTLAQLRATALAAGFAGADIDAELAAYGDARAITYTVQIAGGAWTEFETVDDAGTSVQWSGPYTIVDAGTAVAGEPPCGPITYDYRITGDHVAFVVLDDVCVEEGVTPIGELIAQTTIYESAPFVRLSP